MDTNIKLKRATLRYINPNNVGTQNIKINKENKPINTKISTETSDSETETIYPSILYDSSDNSSPDSENYSSQDENCNIQIFNLEKKKKLDNIITTNNKKKIGLISDEKNRGYRTQPKKIIYEQNRQINNEYQKSSKSTQLHLRSTEWNKETQSEYMSDIIQIDLPISHGCIENDEKNRGKKHFVIQNIQQEKVQLIETNVEIDYIKNPSNNEIEYDDLLITPLELLERLKDEKFLTKVVDSIKGFLLWKKLKYKEKLMNITQEIVRIRQKMEYINKFSSTDISKENNNWTADGSITDEDVFKTKNANDLFPMYDTLLINISTLSEIIIKIKQKIKTLKRKEIYENLIEAITNREKGILSLTGKRRLKIRNQLATQLYTLSRGCEAFKDSFLNVLIMGPSGLGKTKLANVIAYTYSKCGILITDHVTVITRVDLIGSHIGQTAPKTVRRLFNSLEEVLFIDEIYQLTPMVNENGMIENTRDYGPEAITEIVNFLDKFVGLSIVIGAGYEEPIKRSFLSCNEGMSRRFPFRFILEPYTSDDLFEILENFFYNKFSTHFFSQLERNYIYSLICILNSTNDEIFNNQAGDMLNLSSFIINRIFSSYRIKWEKDNIQNNIIIINAGFTDFALNKGIKLFFPT